MAVAKTKPCDMEDMAKQNLKEDQERKDQSPRKFLFVGSTRSEQGGLLNREREVVFV